MSWRNWEIKISLPFCAGGCNCCSAFPPLCTAEQSSELWAQAVMVNLLHHSREDSFYLPCLGEHVWASCMIPWTRCHLLGGDHSSWQGGMTLSQEPNPSDPRWTACRCWHVCRAALHGHGRATQVLQGGLQVNRAFIIKSNIFHWCKGGSYGVYVLQLPKKDDF